MRIVVLSDSHGNRKALENVILGQPEAKLFLFLGDGLREFEDVANQYPGITALGVRGNCDWSMDAKLFDTVFCKKKKLLFTHGHTSQVKRSLDPLLQHAAEQKADILLFGHTHTALTAYIGGIHVMNPGSIAQPRDGWPSYGIIDITSAGIVTNIVRV